jgi:hypothetical protein
MRRKGVGAVHRTPGERHPARRKESGELRIRLDAARDERGQRDPLLSGQRWNGDTSERGDQVVNGTSFRQGVSPGSWVTILGSNLAGSARPCAAADFAEPAPPTQLAVVSV